MPNEKKVKEEKARVRDKIEEVMKRYGRWKESEEVRESRYNI
jgi:hypothetical protein